MDIFREEAVETFIDIFREIHGEISRRSPVEISVWSPAEILAGIPEDDWK